MAVVVENHPNAAEWGNPRIRIIADANGKEVSGEVEELSHSGCSRSIIGTLDPRLYGLDVSHYFF